MHRPEDEASDRLAQRAARLVFDGGRSDLESALNHLDAPRRLMGLARRHLEGMRASALEPPGGSRRLGLRLALDVLETLEDLEERLADDRCIHRGSVLVGRIVDGQHEPGDVLHVRHHGDRPISELELELSLLEVREPASRSLMTRYGRIGTLEFELDGFDFRVLRCPPAQIPRGARNLVSGAPVASMDRASLERHLAGLDR